MSAISDTLRDGINEVYSVFFDTNVKFQMLLDTTTNNVYKEIVTKSYSEPYYLLAKVSPYNTKDNPVPVNNPIGALTFKVPLLSLEKNKLTTDTQELKKGKFVYGDKSYKILGVTAGLNLDGVFLTYLFTCEEDIR